MGYRSLDLGGLRSYKPITIASLKGKAANPLSKGETLLHRQLKDSKKEENMDIKMEHYELEDWTVLPDGGIILYFEHGHSYIDRRQFLVMINELTANKIELINNEEE